MPLHTACRLIYCPFCLATGPEPLPKRLLRVWTSSFSFKSHHLFFPLRLSSSYLRLLPRLLFPFTYLPVTCFRRQFLRKMCPIQLAFLRFIAFSMFLFSLALCNSSFVTQSVQLHTIKKFGCPVSCICWVAGYLDLMVFMVSFTMLAVQLMVGRLANLELERIDILSQY
jgi:hypothetical protein